MRKQSIVWLTLSGLVLAVLSGCAAPYIKGTKVKSTPQNEAVVSVVQQYRYHFYSKQWDQLLKLVSPRFHETRGTASTGDDYGYATLRKKLLSPNMRKIRIIRLNIEVDKITYPIPTEAHVFIRKSYTFLYPRGQYRPGLDTGTLRQKMILEFDQGRWLFRRW